ncbi:MAG: penicillin-binding protein 1C [Hyphomicrobiales bacterium]|nr:penicillin-binding protein 1C [Hyphomicrobiales bacterium]MBV9051434.1 penicillin-binding protein 1C [Hyphomicrobiales bacterium]
METDARVGPRGGQPSGSRRQRVVGPLRLLGAAFVLSVVLAIVGLCVLWRVVAELGPVPWPSEEGASPVVLDRSGVLLRAFTTSDGRWRMPVEVQEVDPRYIAMLIAYEDRRFLQHGGIDIYAVVRASLQLLAHGRVVSGASTLTMQVARLLEPRADRSMSAKLRQMIRAVEIERSRSKSEVLDLYLALAPYGGNIEGLRAASFAYFGKEPKRLSIGEAALLVALPQSPETRRPDRFPQAAERARQLVLERARERGLISVAEAEYARAEPIPYERRIFPALAAHAAQEAHEATPDERVIRLTLDARLQSALEALARQRLAPLDPRLSAAILVVDNATGELRAHVGSPDFLSEQRSGSIDMARALRSPGSALKPFIYALAFEDGIAHPETLIDDRPARYGTYAPENFDLGYQGAVTARHALQMSLNLPAVSLLSQVGPERLIARLRSAGARIELPKGTEPGLAIGLGGLGTTLEDLVRLYAGLARGGEVMPLVRRLGDVASKPSRFTEAVPAWYVADILKGAPPPLNGAADRIAFKTGTSYGYRDAWAVGFDRATTIAVWVGRPDNGAVPGLVGRITAAPILFDAFARLNRDVEIIPPPPGALFPRSTAALPPPLRHLGSRDELPPQGGGTLAAETLKIAFPLDGSDIDLGLTSGDGATPLALKALGGSPPLTWLVNGAPVLRDELRRNSAWAPDGAGFIRLTVIDAAGATDSISVRLE